MSRLARPRTSRSRRRNADRANAATLAVHLLLSALIAIPSGDAKAELLGDFYPDGVPGYGEARGVTVLSRLHPMYDPLGVDIGGYTVKPELDESVGYDSNPLGVANGKGSAVINTTAQISFNDNMDTYTIGAVAGVSNNIYPELPDDDYTNYYAALGAAIDVGDGRLTLGAAHLFLHQDPTTIDAIPASAPIGFTIRATYGLNFGRWTAAPSLSYQSWHFNSTTALNGLPLPQAYRDRDIVQGGMTFDYELGPQRKAVFSVQALDTHYPNGLPGQPTQDSQSYLALVGLDYDGDGIWRWRFLVGGELREFTSSAYHSHAAPVGEADVTWNPSGLTTVSGQLMRTIEDASQEGVAGFTYTRARVVVDHEYLRNVFLQARAAMQVAQFLQGGGVQTIETIGAGVTWLVNRHLRLAINYDHTAQQGGPSAPGLSTGNYVRDLALVTLRLLM
ncbi:MAG TPA: outer membrane beta-barrel protein [Acidisphaera sp.]|nr:outer membrane beta-barrel protein [Acidisphaera sp.]